MRKGFAGRFVLTTAAMVVAAFWAAQAQERGGAPDPVGQPRPAPQGRGRGPAEPPLPTPRLPDGTVNLGRVVGEKGVWNVPYITNMGMRVVDDTGKSVVPVPDGGAGGGRGRAGGGAPLGGGEGGGGGGRGGTKSEPWVPFQPWAAAVYDYNSVNLSKSRS